VTSASTILRLKEASPLPIIAGEYLQLRKQGTCLTCCCPFHDERTPSFKVHATFWKCFGCGAGGDVITFLSTIENISKGEAIRILSERTGIPLDGKPTTRLERIYNQEEQAFAEWWWKRSCGHLARRLTAYAIAGSEEEAESAGLLWRQMAGVKRSERAALAQRCATVEERREWKADLEDARACAEVCAAVLVMPTAMERAVANRDRCRGYAGPDEVGALMGELDWDAEIALIGGAR
jgi:hypothetical protein